MNIFQYLGLPELHRKLSNKVTQLVKHFAEVPDSRKKGKRYGIQLKKDGVCAITIVRDGVPAIYSRTGRRFTNTSKICHNIQALNLRDGVYFGELCCDLEHISLEMLSGVVNPNRTAEVTEIHEAYDALDNMHMYFYDLISIESFKKGTSNTDFQRRYNNLVERIYEPTNTTMREPENVSVVNLVPVETSQIEHWLEVAVKNGEEGIVIIDLDADWEAGHKGHRKMKLVRGVDYDLRCIGYEEGTGKYAGKVANLIFQWKDGKTIKAMLGKGWTHEMAEEMFHAIKRGESLGRNHGTKMSDPVGKIFQVVALEESSKGKLRLPKVREQRHDKQTPDVG